MVAILKTTQIQEPSSATANISLDSSGNVGIGTTSPGSLLHIQSSAPSLRAQETSANAVRGFFSAASTGVYVTTDYAATGIPIVFGTGGVGAAATERMRIDSSGNLLVNTTSADARFVVVDSATSGWGARILKSSGSGTPQGLQVVVGQNSTNEVFQCAQGTSFTSPTNLFRITGNGGINTGTASVSPYNNTTASAANMVVSASGDLQRSTSSLKYKTDVKDSTHGLAEVLQLRPVTYKGKNDGNKVFGGLIAEEVDAVGLTEFVQYAEDGSPDALAYGNMVSLLVKAIQELTAKVTALEAKVGV